MKHNGTVPVYLEEKLGECKGHQTTVDPFPIKQHKYIFPVLKG